MKSEFNPSQAITDDGRRGATPLASDGQFPRQERRRYVRLKTVFPVQLSLTGASLAETKTLQAFTRDVSEGGCCLELRDPPALLTGALEQTGRFGCHLELEVPYQAKPLCCEVLISWYREVVRGAGRRMLLGVTFQGLPPSEGRQLEQYARRKNREPYLWSTLMVLMFLSLGISQYFSHRLHRSLATSTTLVSGLQAEKRELQERWQRMNRHAMMNEKTLDRFETRLRDLETSLDNARRETLEARSDRLRLRQELLRLEQKREMDEGTATGMPHPELERAREGELEAASRLSTLEKLQGVLEEQLVRLQEERNRMAGEIQQLESDRNTMTRVIERLQALDSVQVVQVVLDNGHRLTGQILSETDNDLELKFGNGTLVLEKSRIQTRTPLPLQTKKELLDKWRAEETSAREAPLPIPRAVPVEIKPAPLPGETSHPVPPVSIVMDRIHVMGRPYFIKGIAYGIEYPKVPSGMHSFNSIPRDVFVNDFRMIRKAGFNTLRTYEPLNQELLDLAWAEGLRVIMNVCYPNDITDFESRIHLDHHREQAVKAVRRFKDHPAVLMWSLWNDAPWVWGEGGNPVPVYGRDTVTAFLAAIALAVKEEDPSRPVTASNVLGFAGQDLGFEFLDVLGFNAYLGGLDWYQEEDARQTLDALKGIARETGKPVVILETGFSTFIEGLNQDEVLEEQIRLVGDHLAGITIFQWADGWDKAGHKDRQDFHIEEHWGIVDGFRNPKPGYQAVSVLFNKIPTESMGLAATS